MGHRGIQAVNEFYIWTVFQHRQERSDLKHDWVSHGSVWLHLYVDVGSATAVSYTGYFYRDVYGYSRQKPSISSLEHFQLNINVIYTVFFYGFYQEKSMCNNSDPEHVVGGSLYLCGFIKATLGK